jgi:hypothetical protein
LASAFLQYSAEFGDTERVKVEETIVRHLVNIQSGYPAFFKFADADKAVVVQSPCDGLAKAIQQYRLWYDKKAGLKNATPVSYETVVSVDGPNAETAPQTTRQAITCGKCGSDSFVKIDGCIVCQGCGFSKCG